MSTYCVPPTERAYKFHPMWLLIMDVARPAHLQLHNLGAFLMGPWAQPWEAVQGESTEAMCFWSHHQGQEPSDTTGGWHLSGGIPSSWGGGAHVVLTFTVRMKPWLYRGFSRSSRPFKVSAPLM